MSKYSEALTHLEITLFLRAMKENQYNQSRAAKDLGISRANFRNKLKVYFGDEFIANRSNRAN